MVSTSQWTITSSGTDILSSRSRSGRTVIAGSTLALGRSTGRACVVSGTRSGTWGISGRRIRTGGTGGIHNCRTAIAIYGSSKLVGYDRIPERNEIPRTARTEERGNILKGTDICRCRRRIGIFEILNQIGNCRWILRSRQARTRVDYDVRIERTCHIERFSMKQQSSRKAIVFHA